MNNSLEDKKINEIEDFDTNENTWIIFIIFLILLFSTLFWGGVLDRDFNFLNSIQKRAVSLVVNIIN